VKGLRIRFRLLNYFIPALLFFSPGLIISQDVGDYSSFRKKIAPLFFSYELEEALALCNKSDESDREVIASKSMVYSLMGNRDKNDSYIEKGFDLVKPFSSEKGDYNILSALALSYGIQANHSGLKKQVEFSQLSVSYCKEALKLDPNLPHPNFILGRFYFELSDMSKVTAKVAGTILDKKEIERASFELALSYLVKASNLVPDRFLYNYYTGEAYNRIGDEDKASFYFHLADKNVRHTEDDLKADKDLAKHLK
jgi:tetratricopeptide (TPR) repeat protein